MRKIKNGQHGEPWVSDDGDCIGEARAKAIIAIAQAGVLLAAMQGISKMETPKGLPNG